MTTNEDKMTSSEFLDALDEVHTRFILNLPPEELATADRLFFQMEQAWWFYEDMICDQLADDDPVKARLPRFNNMKNFAKQLFVFSPFFADIQNDFGKLWKEFSDYKRKISTYGTILLNEDCTHLVLCQMYNSDVWTFPAGKINQGELGIEAAARETYEETGFDPHCTSGVTKEWLREQQQDSSGSVKLVTWPVPLDEDNNGLTFVEQNGKRRTCYICPNVPMDFDFAPVCRKEVGKIRWFNLSNNEIPKKSFAVLPFMKGLRRWVNKQQKKKKNSQRAKSRSKSEKKGQRDKSSGRDKSLGRDKSSGRRRDRDRSNRRQDSQRNLVVEGDDNPLVDTGLAGIGDATRWSEEEMFKTNEKLIGRSVDYDGNPHIFAEQGFGNGPDPHSFRVVGGAFMNSTQMAPNPVAAGDGSDPSAAGSTTTTTDADRRAKYQPLVRNEDANNHTDDLFSSSTLQPFFSDDGVTPWGDVVKGAESQDGSRSRDETPNAPPGTKKNQQNKKKNSKKKKTTENKAKVVAVYDSADGSGNESSPFDVLGVVDDDNYEDVDDVMTDYQITRKSQEDHVRKQRLIKQYEEDMAFVRRWVSNLPKPVEFKIQNVDEIIEKHFGVTTN